MYQPRKESYYLESRIDGVIVALISIIVKIVSSSIKDWHSLELVAGGPMLLQTKPPITHLSLRVTRRFLVDSRSHDVGQGRGCITWA